MNTKDNSIQCPKCKNFVWYRNFGGDYQFTCAVCKYKVGKKQKEVKK